MRCFPVFIAALLLPLLAGGQGTLPGEFQFDETYVGEGSVERNARRQIVDFDESDTLLQLVLTPRVKIGVLRLGVQYERFSFGFGERAALPNRLQSVAAVVGLDTQFSDSILVRWEAEPGFYGERLRADNFNMPFLVGGTYIYSPDLQLVLGAGVDVERKYPVLPGGGVRWKIAPSLVLNAVLPTPRIEYELSKNLTAYVGGNFKEASYRVNGGFGNQRGRPELNHAVITYGEVRTGAGVDWKIANWVSLNVEGGYQPYRSFDFYRLDTRYHQDDGAPYGMISFHGAF